MSVIIVFIAAITALAGIYLSRQRLGAKPWLETGLAGDLREGDAHAPLSSAKVGLVVFLAVASSLFALTISAYFMRMELPDWRPLPTLKILWLNTGLLVAGSLALQGAVAAARRSLEEAARTWLAAGGLLTLAFVAGQILAWRWLLAEGYSLDRNPANAFFFLLTGLHGLHVLGGVFALGRTADKAWRRGARLDELRQNLELCALYWHFLLVVWLILLGLLSGVADGVAAFCRGLVSS